MKMALTDGMVRIIEADAIQKTIIKSWNQMRWIRGQQMYEGIASAERGLVHECDLQSPEEVRFLDRKVSGQR